MSESLLCSMSVDFSDPFFEATGRGQRRIRQALKMSNGIEVKASEDELKVLRQLVFK